MRLVFISNHSRKYEEWTSQFGNDEIMEVPLTFSDPKMKNRKYDEVVAFGSSRVIDYAKLYSYKAHLPLTAIPTSITTDCLFTSDTAIRKNNWVYYVESKKPDKILIDTKLLLKNKKLCDYGWLEIVSALTSKHSYGSTLRKKVAEYNSAVIKLLRELEPVEDKHSLFGLLNALSKEVEICEKNGSSLLVEEGIEHYLSYALENSIPQRLFHGEYLALALSYLRIGIRYLKKLGLKKDYRSYGLTSENMNDAFKLAKQVFFEDVKKVYGG